MAAAEPRPGEPQKDAETREREPPSWNFLSDSQISDLLGENIDGLQKQLQTSLKEAILLDYYVSGFWWAKEINFTLPQLSKFMTLLYTLLENLSAKHMFLEDNIRELGKALAVLVQSHSEKSDDLDFFSVDQANAITDYLKISLFQHYKLYEFLFYSPREELVIGAEAKCVDERDSRQGSEVELAQVIELLKQADDSFPAPLEEGISYDIYSTFIAPPSPVMKTEETDEECPSPLREFQPETESVEEDPLCGYTIEDVESVLGQLTDEAIEKIQTEINEKLQIQEKAFNVKIEKLKKA
ncbi:ciliary-associated calcium-binding coiled-coil protein 1 isoform X2 [Ornithorhynchus anatinus]|uniref:ciliary-associated calcium-binding coiled-coil protein 1 isoform X2 n=1 Tax=Ornithorhynchus anatinus TaxID=9258 RepID=UPI0019D49560|nr:ciliary-associated calcium-binding coiled-coil protein 1 isoform X2 [Ornithorhynchus anatinus]